jgi:hypothetical protein
MALLGVLRGAGLNLEARPNGAVHVQPQSLLTAQRRQAILEHKADILAALNLERRIKEMAARWGYAADELIEALKGAQADPNAWLLMVSVDEQRAALTAPTGGARP